MTTPFLGLALGGGGARGAAHIGVLQELEKSNIRIDMIAGTSAGSTIGAMYAATGDPDWVENRFREFLVSDVFKGLRSRKLLKDRNPGSVLEQIAKKVKEHYVIMMGLNRKSFIKKEPLQAAISFLIPVKTFEELIIPLKVIATDICSGEDMVHDSGDLVEAIVQSSSIPGFVLPTTNGDKTIVDGGVSMPIPVPVIKNSCELTIAVDVSRYQLGSFEDPNILEIIKRSDIITSLRLKSRLAAEADFVIRPDVVGLHWSDFDQFDILLENGRKAARDVINQLEIEIDRRNSLFYRMKQWLS